MTSKGSPSNSTENYDDPPGRLSRSPHPYSRRKGDHAADTDSPSSPYLPTPALTPSHSDTERTFSRAKAASSPLVSLSPSGSGTEADDESLCFTKALPAPPSRPRKGLKDYSESQGDRLRAADSSAVTHKHEPSTISGSWHNSGAGKTPLRQFSRRQCEILCLFVIGIITFLGVDHAPEDGRLIKGYFTPFLLVFSVVLSGLCALYPMRLSLSSFVHYSRLRRPTLYIPLSLDPAPLLYPPVLPLLIGISLFPTYPAAFLPNLILGLCAMPGSLVPSTANFDGHNMLHWLLSTAPLLVSELPQHGPKPLPGWVGGHVSVAGLNERETLVLLYPLHQAMLTPLRYLTTSSLLPAELQLLSIALINVLLLASSPQMLIMKYVMWVGGVGLLFTCTWVLRKNLALERVPVWRFRRTSLAWRASKTLLATLAEGMNPPAESNDEKKRSRQELREDLSHRPGCVTESKPTSSHSPPLATDRRQVHRRKRTMSSSMQSLLTMTSQQAEMWKWLYAGYVYISVVALVLGPIRLLIQTQALQNFEPFGWAVGYLFGNIPLLHEWAHRLRLTSWIPLDNAPGQASAPRSWVDRIRWHDYGQANSRLLLFVYWASVLTIGIATVQSLSKRVETDTRRKIFHGTMVAMLVPTAFIDPPFLSLGLILVLAVFLLLELFRAGQLRPLSKPLALFLSPYVDGRDLRGPIVVSHIFLLIGCAIPFWLASAGIEPLPSDPPWTGWEAASRDVSMLSGVICVGLGDAAASRVGRRFGRHKWPWEGGKSLEGSAAFAVAVSLGLVASKAWLVYGGWSQTYDDGDSWVTTWGKAGIASLGASFMEAVLTGCNDNVVVPVILWLLVRGMRL